MSWFIISLINPLTHALSNYLDKYVLSKFVKDASAWALAVFSSLAAAVVLPIVAIFHPSVIKGVSVGQASFLMLNGACLTMAVAFYLKALQKHNASSVATLFQLVPVFGLGLGYMVLGESLSAKQLLAGLLILIGGVIVTLQIDTGRFQMRWRLIGYMALSALFYSFNAVGFKLIAVEQGFWGSLFWDMLGKLLFGLLLLAVWPKILREFKEIIHTGRHHLWAINFLSEAIAMFGDLSLMFAVLYAPVALVQSVGSLQPILAFVLGLIFTKIAPDLFQESFAFKNILKKISGTLIVASGVLLLVLT